MSFEAENIDKLVKEKLEGFSMETPDALWSQIDGQLRYRNFFKFSPGTVNIYYTIVAAIIITSSTLFYFNEFNTKKFESIKVNIDKEENSIPENNIKSDTLEVPQDLKKNEKVEQKKDQSCNKFNEEKNTVITTTPLENTTNIDTVKAPVQYEEKKDSVKILKAIQKKKVKKQVVIKAPPVVVRDTIYKDE